MPTMSSGLFDQLWIQLKDYAGALSHSDHHMRISVDSQFNLVIRFCPGKLGEKPDALTRQWDIYPKKGDNQYTAVNPHNF